jgi:uncharacterized membrane protein YfcA
MSVTIAGLSLLVAGVGVAQLLSPLFARWNQSQELTLGALVVVLAICGFRIGRWLAARHGTRTVGSASVGSSSLPRAAR